MTGPHIDQVSAFSDCAFFVTGGRQRLERGGSLGWRTYDRALILRIDPCDGQARKMVEYETPLEIRADEDPSIVFKAGTKVGDRLYVCTSTEAMAYSLPSFRQLAYVSHPWFNDLHHVAMTSDGAWVVVNTGLDMVMMMSSEGEVLAEYTACDEPLWSRFSPDIDYRKIPTTQPHRAHPNYAFFLGDDLWVTRSDVHDAICLTRPQPHITIPHGYAHDGLARFGRIYFTSVDGWVSVFDAGTRELIKSVNLSLGGNHSRPLGWCRGIEVIAPDLVVVGFSKTRRTQLKEKLAWVRSRFGDPAMAPSEPTRIAAYNLSGPEMLWELELESYDLNAVFSIFRDDYRSARVNSHAADMVPAMPAAVIDSAKSDRILDD
jgi:hypothetical protein